MGLSSWRVAGVAFTARLARYAVDCIRVSQHQLQQNTIGLVETVTLNQNLVLLDNNSINCIKRSAISFAKTPLIYFMLEKLFFLPVAVYPVLLISSIKYFSRFEFYPENKRNEIVFSFARTFIFLVYPILLCGPIYQLISKEKEDIFTMTLVIVLWGSHCNLIEKAVKTAIGSLKWIFHVEACKLVPDFEDHSKLLNTLNKKIREISDRHGIWSGNGTVSPMTWQDVKDYKILQFGIERCSELAQARAKRNATSGNNE